MALSFRTDISRQTVQTQFRLLLEEKSEQGLHSLLFHLHHLSRDVRKPDFAYAETKTQISLAVTAKLISTFVFATRIVQPLYFLNLKFQVSSLIQ